MSPEEIKVRALVFDLEKIGILRRKGTAYLYNDQQVGFDYCIGRFFPNVPTLLNYTVSLQTYFH